MVDELQGSLIDGELSVSSDSDIRRACNISLSIRGRSLLVGETTRVWLDKFVRLSFGARHQRTGRIRWYPLGVFALNDNSYEYSAASRSLTLSCLDLMCGLTGMRNGQVAGTPATIPQGSPIRSAMVSAVAQLGKVKNYLIDDIGKEVSYDLTFPTGFTVYEMVAKLRGLYPGWETFFDVGGTFVCQPIPTCAQGPVLFDDPLLQRLLLTETLTNSFSAVKNVTEVWGKTIEATRYAGSSAYAAGSYTVALDSFDLAEGVTVGFKASASNGGSPTLQINALPPCPLVDGEEKPLASAVLLAGKSYVVKYRRGKFYFLGQFQIHAIAKEVSAFPSSGQIDQEKRDSGCDTISYVVNPDSPYTVEKIGEVRQVFSGGEFEDIYSDELARQRAEYENWESTRLQYSITLEIMGIPWLDVNQKIEYTPKNSEKACQYLVKNINRSLKSGIQTVECVKFYPLYLR